MRDWRAFVTSGRFVRLSGEGLWIVLGQAAVVAGVLVGVRVLTEIMDPAAYGELALGMTLATLVNQTVLGPLSLGATRFYAPAREAGDFRGYLGAVRRLVMPATGVLLLVSAAAVSCLAVAGCSHWAGLAAASLVFAIFYGYDTIVSGMQNAARHRAIVALHQGLVSWARFLAAAGIVLIAGATSVAAMWGYALGSLAVLLSQVFFLRRTTAVASLEGSGPGEEQRWRKGIWSYSWPFSAWGIFTWSQMASDRWALDLFSTRHDVGMYSALFQLGFQPMVLCTSMGTAILAPVLFQRAGDAVDIGRMSDVRDMSFTVTLLVLVATVVAFVAAMALHARIFGLLVSVPYAPISYLLPWMLLAGGLFAAGQAMTLNIMSQLKTKSLSAVKIVTACLGLAANLAGAYFDGVRGIVAASLFSSLLYFAWVAKMQWPDLVRSCRRWRAPPEAAVRS